jgi:hypothetical protein
VSIELPKKTRSMPPLLTSVPLATIGQNQQPQKEEEQRDHRGRRYVILLPDQTDEVFGTHTSTISG